MVKFCCYDGISFLLAACSKDDSRDIHRALNLIDRNSLDIEHFIYQGLDISGCCSTLWIRTNLLNSFEHIGGVSLNFYKQGAGVVKSIITDSRHRWIYDPETNADFSYKWRISCSYKLF